MKQNVILFIFEGKETEKKIMKKIEKICFGEKYNFITFNSNIYALYNLLMKEYDDLEDIDIITVLKNRKASNNNFSQEELKKLTVKNVSEIYLFFDLDAHDGNYDANKIRKMLNFFNNENDKGKLYINYPMVESFYDLSSLIGDTLENKSISIKKCLNNGYKNKVKEFSCFETIKKFTDVELKPILFHNVKKFNCLLNGSYDIPKFQQIKEDIGNHQGKLFDIQVKEYIQPLGEISIISSIPLFLVEYFSEDFYGKYVLEQ